MTEFYAQPYSIDHQGFYFNDLESFHQGMSKLNKLGCEEVEIQFINGETYQAELSKMASLGQCDIHLWFEVLEEFSSYQAQQLTYLLDAGYSLYDALDKYEDVSIQECTAKDYAYDLIQDCYDLPDSLAFYLDYEAIARDMQINGEISEINHDLIVTNANEF